MPEILYELKINFTEKNSSKRNSSALFSCMTFRFHEKYYVKQLTSCHLRICDRNHVFHPCRHHGLRVLHRDHLVPLGHHHVHVRLVLRVRHASRGLRLLQVCSVGCCDPHGFHEVHPGVCGHQGHVYLQSGYCGFPYLKKIVCFTTKTSTMKKNQKRLNWNQLSRKRSKWTTWTRGLELKTRTKPATFNGSLVYSITSVTRVPHWNQARVDNLVKIWLKSQLEHLEYLLGCWACYLWLRGWFDWWSCPFSSPGCRPF